MPVCYITLSESTKKPDASDIDQIRDIVAKGLLSRARYLDRNHVVIRIQYSQRCHMLGEIEIDVFAQFDLQRYLSRDKRAKQISTNISKLLRSDCATWINLGRVGYCRVTKSGEEFYSD